MPRIIERKIYRAIDANWNRAKEALRVCEDISRFVLDEQSLSGQWKQLRHGVFAASRRFGAKNIDLLQERDIGRDVGRATILPESRRKNVEEVFFANAQRAKESVRVLEEFAKLIDAGTARDFKNIRYKIYAAEQRAHKKF